MSPDPPAPSETQNPQCVLYLQMLQPIDGRNCVFTLDYEPDLRLPHAVLLNGVTERHDTDYHLIGPRTLRYVVPPKATDMLRIAYFPMPRGA